MTRTLEDVKREVEGNLSTIPDQLGPAITESLLEAEPTFEGSSLTSVAIKTADMHTVPCLSVCTERRLAEVQAEYQRLGFEPDDPSLRFFPDEWDWDLDGSGKFNSIAHAFEQQYEDGLGALPRDDQNDFRDWWLEAGRQTLVASLGHPSVREVFTQLGCNPILVVTETDGGWDMTLRSFKELNAGRDDEPYQAALAYWEAAAA